MKCLTSPVPVTINPLQPIDVAFDRVALSSDSHAVYHGPYEVTPDFAGAVLETKDKLMAQNVTVHPISVQKTTNPSGGYTVVIGG